MGPIELAESMLDAISKQSADCLDRANKAANEANSANADDKGRLSAESERWREAARQLRIAQNECQQILDNAEAQVAA